MSPYAVRVALDSRSDASTQLKAAIAAEIVDYLIRNNWSPQVLLNIAQN